MRVVVHFKNELLPGWCRIGASARGIKWDRNIFIRREILFERDANFDDDFTVYYKSRNITIKRARQIELNVRRFFGSKSSSINKNISNHSSNWEWKFFELC